MICWSLRPNSPKGILFAPPHVRSFIHSYVHLKARERRRKECTIRIYIIHVCVCVFVYSLYVQYVCVIDSGSSSNSGVE